MGRGWRALDVWEWGAGLGGVGAGEFGEFIEIYF